MTEGLRGRGWGSVAALAVATAVLSVVQPGLLIFVPLALLLVALPPRRPLLLALAGFIGWLAFGSAADSSLWYLERAWTLLLGGWFVVMVVLLPGRRFLSRALSAVVATALTAVAVLAANRDGFARLDRVVSDHVRGGAAQALAGWSRAVGFDQVGTRFSQAVYAMAEWQAKLYPALLALGSLAALGVAWWAFRRVAHNEPRPLGRLREFRFRDELVWVFLAGLVLLVLPLDALATRAGENVLLFMAALYALRGAAVLMVIGGMPGPLGLVLLGLLVFLLYPLVMATTFVVGLSDTWLDIRARRQASSNPGS